MVVVEEHIAVDVDVDVVDIPEAGQADLADKFVGWRILPGLADNERK